MGIVLALGWRFRRHLTERPSMATLLLGGGFSYSLYLIHPAFLAPIENVVGRIIPFLSRGYLGT